MKREQIVSSLKTFLDNLDKATLSNKLKADLIIVELERLGMTTTQQQISIKPITFKNTWKN